jgi:cell division protein FtsA
MFAASNIIAGLEIGTSKICVVVGEQSANGELNIIGVGQSPSNGVRKGEVVNPKQVEEDLRAAVFQAEQMADVEIRSVYLGVTGGHIHGFNNRGFHRVVSAGGEILPVDVEDVIENAKAIRASTIHIMPSVSCPQYFSRASRTRLRSDSLTSVKVTRRNSRLAVSPS